MEVNITPTRQAQIDVLTNNGTQDYYRAYDYIYQIIKDDPAVSTATKTWFEQAVFINSNDLDAASNIFIRSHTAIGQVWSNGAALNMQAVSDRIGAQVYFSIQNKGGVVNIQDFVQFDITTAIQTYGLTPAGWGGSTYYWDLEIPWNGKNQSIGAHIMGSPLELEKFISTSAASMSATIASEWVGSYAEMEALTAFKIGVTSDVPQWIKQEIFSRSLSGNYSGNPNQINYNGNWWTYNSTTDQWHSSGGYVYGGPVTPNTETTAKLDAIRDIRLEHANDNIDTYGYTVSQILGMPYVFGASGTYSVIHDMGWQNSDGSLNLEAFLNAGNGSLSNNFLNLGGNGYYILGPNDHFSLTTPYLDSLLQSGAIKYDSILQVSLQGFTGSIGQSWASVASGQSQITNAKTFFSNLIGLNNGMVNPAIKNYDQYVSSMDGKSLNEQFREAFGPNTEITDSTEYVLFRGDAVKAAEDTFAPEMKGVIKARIYLAKPNTTVYVDPYITLSNNIANRRQYMLPGFGSINETAQGEFSYVFVG